ncbi:hypothetical protein O0I10_001022 [Lichtheimia ornata]|uniref:Uncharacterized protein n=1 Tax=Lichtheimia ornata TaxID=688661 RepID=A0AAD7Y2Z9_9FUNG|nr:uncharacterized protein O0I10_001022 [Lichtheimia ornata]KAJ8662846.1 hypothetical protein O0I10_001022 [Lichtheimia ornata]
MDLQWCIVCDVHVTDDQLYCSEQCRLKDAPSIMRQQPSSPPISPKTMAADNNNITIAHNDDDDIQLPPLSPTSTCIDGLLPSPPNTPVTTIQYLTTS